MWSDFAETKLDGFKVNHRTKIDIFKDGIWAEIQQETIKEEEIDWSVPQLVISKNENKVISITGEHNEDRFTGLVNISDNKYQPVNHYSKRWVKDCFKKFKGELTIK